MLTSVLCVALWIPAPAWQEELPDRKEQEALVEAYLARDPYTKAGFTEGARLLEQLAGVPFPGKSELRRWDKFLAKHSKELPLLPKKAGQYFDLGDGRGRYFLGGKMSKPKGIFVGLHGGGVGSGDAGSARDTYAGAVIARDWLGIYPQVLEKTELGWTDSGTEEWVLSLIDRAIRTFDVDPDHVYLGGHSMGGYGTWVMGADHADRFAALAPSAGAPSFESNPSRGTIRIQKGVVPNLRNTPMCVFQSTDDPKVGPEANQAAVRDVKESQRRWGGYGDFEYWEVGDRGHSLPVGGADALLARIDEYTRDAAPTELVWQPRVDWKEQFYWLLWEGGARVRGTVFAEVDRKRGTVDVRLERARPEGLSVLLSGALVDMDREVTVYLNGIKVFEGLPPRSLATWIRGRALGDPGRTYEARIALAPGD